MARPRSHLQPMLLATAVIVFGHPALQGAAKAADEPALCNLGSLPPDIQSHLKKDFRSWKVQDTTTLSENARKTWAARKPQACPGSAAGLFQNTKATSYAVLLVPADHPDTAYRLVVFTARVGEPSFDAVVVEHSNVQGASNYFIRKVSVREFFSAESKRKFQVEATEAIEMIDSAEKEYEGDIYFWSNGRFRQEPVDD